MNEYEKIAGEFLIDKAERIGRLLEEDKPEGGERNISLEDQFSKPKLSIWYSGQEDPVTIKNTDIDPEVKKDQSGNSYMTITVHDNDGKDQNHKLPLAEVQYMEWRRERLNDKRS